MALYDGITLAVGKNLFIASSTDVCDICLNDEKAKIKTKLFTKFAYSSKGD